MLTSDQNDAKDCTPSLRLRLRPYLRSSMGSLLVIGGIAVLAAPGGASSGDAPITGTVFRDVDANGKLGTTEPGQSGIIVTATDSLGAVSSATSDADGKYSLLTSSLGAGPFRIEFSGLPSFLQSGPHGTNNQTSVTRAAAAPSSTSASWIPPPTASPIRNSSSAAS